MSDRLYQQRNLGCSENLMLSVLSSYSLISVAKFADIIEYNHIKQKEYHTKQEKDVNNSEIDK